MKEIHLQSLQEMVPAGEELDPPLVGRGSREHDLVGEAFITFTKS